MPVHDWTRVDAGIFHHFHFCWTDQLQMALNGGILPPDYYALAEQQASRLGPDILTLRGLSGPQEEPDRERPVPPEDPAAGGLMVAPPRVRIRAESDLEFYRRKQRTVVVRDVSRDDVVAVIEIVSPGNKDSRKAFQLFVDKATWLLEKLVHLLIVDLQPPTARDTQGVHAAIWEDITGESFIPPRDKPLTLASYEADRVLRAYVEPVAVGDVLPDMPLYLMPDAYVLVPLERTYHAAWEVFPQRWRRVVAGD